MPKYATKKQNAELQWLLKQALKGAKFDAIYWLRCNGVEVPSFDDAMIILLTTKFNKKKINFVLNNYAPESQFIIPNKDLAVDWNYGDPADIYDCICRFYLEMCTKCKRLTVRDLMQSVFFNRQILMDPEKGSLRVNFYNGETLIRMIKAYNGEIDRFDKISCKHTTWFLKQLCKQCGKFDEEQVYLAVVSEWYCEYGHSTTAKVPAYNLPLDAEISDTLEKQRAQLNNIPTELINFNNIQIAMLDYLIKSHEAFACWFRQFITEYTKDSLVVLNKENFDCIGKYIDAARVHVAL